MTPILGTATRWWAALTITWLLLEVVAILQIVLSAATINPDFFLSGFLMARAIEAVLVVLIAAPLLAVARRYAPPARVGAARSLAVMVPIVTVAAFLAGPTGLWIGNELLHAHTRFVGSQLAKGMAEVVSLCVPLVVATTVELQVEVRERTTHTLQLEASLSEARLQMLSSQLQPHFLFNTLTAISVLVHRDAEGAGTMLSRLSELLRATLRQPAAQLIPLRDEMTLIEHYADIMRVRYGPRLTIRTDIPADLGETLVPSFILQPLVENALEHGIARRAGPGQVTISAERANAALQLVVEDDGPGLSDSGSTENGIGLTNTRDRLQQLYHGGASLTLAAAPGGGARAVVSLPAPRADA